MYSEYGMNGQGKAGTFALLALLILLLAPSVHALTYRTNITSCTNGDGTTCTQTEIDNMRANSSGSVGITVDKSETGIGDTLDNLPGDVQSVTSVIFEFRHNGDNGISGNWIIRFTNEADTTTYCSDNTISHQSSSTYLTRNTTGSCSWTASELNDLRIEFESGDSQGPSLAQIEFVSLRVDYTPIMTIDVPINDSPDPATAGNNITYNVTATDPQGDNYRLTVCSSNSITDGYPGTCDATELCTSTATSSGSEATCEYKALRGDVGTKTGYGFVCEAGTNNCISAESTTTTVNRAYGTLSVSINNPANNTAVSQNSTFDVNATVNCTSSNDQAECGTLEATARYNESTGNPDTAINTTTPSFQLVGSGGDITYRTDNWTDCTADECLTPEDAVDLDIGDLSTGVVLRATSTGSKTLTYNFNISDSTEGVVSVTSDDTSSGFCQIADLRYYVKNWSSGQFVSQVASTMAKGETRTTDITDEYYINSTGGVSVKVEHDCQNSVDSSPADWGFSDIYVNGTSGASNPSSCGSLNQGESCNASWTVNATGENNTGWLLDVLFNSTSYPNDITAQDTEDRNVCTGTTCPVGGGGGSDLSFTLSYPADACVDGEGSDDGDTNCNLCYVKTTDNSGLADETNVACQGQSVSASFFKFTNTGNVNLTWEMKLDVALPASLQSKADTDNDPAGATVLTTSNQAMASDIESGETQDIWMWGDFTSATADDSTSVNITSQSSGS